MKNEKDLFDEIENVLHAHEDAYVPGAWEGFVKKKRSRRGIIYLRVAAAAAVLLMLGYAAWLFAPSTQVDTENTQTKNTTKPPYIYPKNNKGNDSLIADRAVASPKSSGGTLVPSAVPLSPTNPPSVVEPALSNNTFSKAVPDIFKTDNNDKATIAANIAPIGMPRDSAVRVKNDGALNNTNTLPGVKQDVMPVATTEARRYDRGTQRLNYDSLANISKPKPVIADEKKSKNLSYAVLVSPSVGNQKMNFGTGLEIAYNINKNFSVSSGLSYAYVNAGTNRNSGGFTDAAQNFSLQGFAASSSTKSSSATSSQSVQGARLTLSGVEIPLNFQYKTAGGFYLSAGVSAMSVIGNNLSYDVINNRAVSIPSANGLANTISVVTEAATERSNEKISSYVGFYTLSAGKKLSFGRGKLNFAPFIKIPFSRVSSENIQLIHGGVQLGFGF